MSLKNKLNRCKFFLLKACEFEIAALRQLIEHFIYVANNNYFTITKRCHKSKLQVETKSGQPEI